MQAGASMCKLKVFARCCYCCFQIHPELFEAVFDALLTAPRHADGMIDIEDFNVFTENLSMLLK